jgi:alpha-D-xyloside xylohydrolase
MMRKIQLLFVLCVAMQLSAAEIKWELVQPGVWRGVIGTPEAYSLLSASGATPYTEGLNKMPQVSLPAFASGAFGFVQNKNTVISIPLGLEEQIYGFGLNFQTVHQRGKILQLHVDHYRAPDNGRNHCPTPFYVSSDGYGVFVNSARYITVYAGYGLRKDSPNQPESPKDRTTDRTWSSVQKSDAVEMLIPAEGVEVYLFAGPTPMDAVRRFNLFCGGGTLPPRWGLGFTQRVPTRFSDEEVRNEVAQFDEKGFPLDFVGLEPGWQSRAYPCSFEWDEVRFPNPAEFTKEMLEKGIRLNLWTNPYVSPESGIYEEMFPLSGSHTVWYGLVPDLSIPEAYNLWKDKLRKETVEIGISGFKVDEVDGYDRYLWPDVATFPSGRDSEQLRQTYGLLVQKLTYELYKERNERTFGLVRASNAGGNSFPYVIYNDYYDHRDFITALINSGFSGVLWTPEVRNAPRDFSEERKGEDWVRRIQSNIFSPMAMINAWSSGTKPWSFPAVTEIVRDFALLRMRLMPYFYTEFAKYRFEGTPPFRAMNLEPGFNISTAMSTEMRSTNLEDNPYLEAVRREIKDQYMAGDYLLVAPMFTGDIERTVVLPMGDWYDFYTGEFVGNGERITVKPGLEKIPVFLKDG